jgi:hypothetical protein
MALVASLDVTRREVRILGPLALALPPVVLAGFGSVLALMVYLHAPHDALRQMVSVMLEAGLPLSAGVTAAAAVLGEPAIELQLTLSVPYRRTALRRVVIVLAWTMAVAALATLACAVAAPWALPRAGPAGLLVPLAPAMWLAALGTLLAVLLRSWTAAGAVLGSLWVAQQVLHGYFATTSWLWLWFLFLTSYDPTNPRWTANRVALIVTALVVAGGFWLYLRMVEWRFTGEEG